MTTSLGLPIAPPGTLMHRTPKNPNGTLQGPPHYNTSPMDFSVAPQGPYKGTPGPFPGDPKGAHQGPSNPTLPSVPHPPWGGRGRGSHTLRVGECHRVRVSPGTSQGACSGLS